MEVTVLVADDHVDAIEDVAAALEVAGLRRKQTLAMTGVITGEVADAAGIESLAAVPGVAGVEPVQEIFIPPPDAPIQ